MVGLVTDGEHHSFLGDQSPENLRQRPGRIEDTVEFIEEARLEVSAVVACQTSPGDGRKSGRPTLTGLLRTQP